MVISTLAGFGALVALKLDWAILEDSWVPRTFFDDGKSMKRVASEANLSLRSGTKLKRAHNLTEPRLHLPSYCVIFTTHRKRFKDKSPSQRFFKDQVEKFCL